MKIFNHRSIMISLISFCFISGCSNHYDSTKPIARTSAYPKVIESAKKDKRYLVMHSGVDLYTVTSLLIDKAKNQFTVQLNPVDSLHKVNMNNPKGLAEKYLHLYMRDSTSYTLDEPHTIPLNRVARIELVD